MLRAQPSPVSRRFDTRQQSQSAAVLCQLDQQAVGRLSRTDAATAASDVQANRQRVQGLVRQIRAALKRLDDDEYGDCVRCGPHRWARLNAQPETPLVYAANRTLSA